MIDTRAMGQELQDQVLAAARKGQQRVASTVKTMTATAQLIRPQLPQLPSLPTLKISALPLPTQVREKAPVLIAKLPTTDQLRTGAQEFAEQVRDVQRQVIDQVRNVATPLAHQAAAAFAQATTTAAKAAKPAVTAAVTAAKAPASEAPASEVPASEEPAAEAPARAGTGKQAKPAPHRTASSTKKSRPAAK